MNKRCSLKQIAKGVILSAMDHDWLEFLIDNDYPAALKSLDTFVATVNHFGSIFEKKFDRTIDNCLKSEKAFSEKDFKNFLAPRCEILSQKCDHFGLILTCSFVSEVLRDFRRVFKCLHYDSPSYKILLELLASKFKALENKSYWNRLLHYCRELNRIIYAKRNHVHHVPLEKLTTSDSSSEDGIKASDEENSRKLSTNDSAETGAINRIKCPGINTEEGMNITDNFTDETDKYCDKIFATRQSDVSVVSQKDEKDQNSTHEINWSDNDSDIDWSPVQEIDNRLDARSSEDSDEHWPTIRAYLDLLMPDQEYKFEIFEMIKKCENEIDQGFLKLPNKEMFDVQMETEISSSSTTVYEEPEKNVGEVMIGCRGEIQTTVDEHESHSKSDTKESRSKCCKKCKGKSFKRRLQKWKMAFHLRYKDLSKVTDLFDRNRINGSSSS